MNEISVGIIYTPVNYTKSINLDLIERLDKITENGEFVINRHTDNLTEFYNPDKKTEITIYSRNSIYFQRNLEKTAFSPTQLKFIAKEGLDFAQKNTPIKDYSRQIGLIVKGDDMKNFYSSKAKEVIKNFGEELFGEYADCKELKLDDRGFHISVKSTEMPVLEIPD
ncbi:MAG: hypothetical protein KAT28_03320 [Candidatus Aenigmarchaeota archaeon]|nr:hypothetical protein [Candidatus Aenigmarchaeota archaeon]